jgi:hypothetical protein
MASIDRKAFPRFTCAPHFRDKRLYAVVVMQSVLPLTLLDILQIIRYR